MAGISPLDSLGKPTSFNLTFDGTQLADNLMVFRIHTWEEVNRIARARIEIVGGDTALGAFPESEMAAFKPGAEVVISLGYDQVNEIVFSGILLKHAISVKTGYQIAFHRSLLVVECADKAVKLTYQKESEIFEKKKDSDIMTTLINAAGVSKTVKATTYNHPFLIQHRMTNWDFLQLRASANGMLLYNSQNKVIVDQPVPAAGASSKSTLIFGENIARFEGEIDAGSQLQASQADTFDPFKTAAVSQTGSEPAGMTTGGDLTGTTLGAVASPSSLSLAYHSPMPSAEIKVYADGLLFLSRIQRIRGLITVRGMNQLALRDKITLQGFGTHFNGETMITGIEHEMSDGSWFTTLRFGLSPNLLHGDRTPNDLQVHPPHRGLHIGKVTKIDADPDSEYRIQVLIPSLKQTGQGIWARLSHFYATSGAGSFFIPEKDSSVIVGFLNEDSRYPVVLGSLYNSTNAPPETIDAANPKKAIYSKSKLKLEFDDKDKILTLLTPGGNSIVCSDKDKTIVVKDANGNQIKTSASGIDLTSDGNITIKAGQKVSIKGTTGIELDCSGGDVSIKGLNVNAEAQVKASVKGAAQAELNASGQTVVKGGVVMIN